MAFSTEHIRIASILAAPIAEMPAPWVRRALRTAAGVSREQVAVALEVSGISVIRAERGNTRLLENPAYRRLLGWFASLYPALGVDDLRERASA